MDGEFELADALNNEVVLVVNALKTEYRRNEERKAAARHIDHVDPPAVSAAPVRHLPTNGEEMMAGVPIAVVPSENETMNSASTDTYNAEDYEWKDDHLGLDLSRVPTQPRDPPVEASLEELKAAWQRTWQDITQVRMWSDDHCAEINGKIRQLLRLNERVRNIVLCEEEPRELPAEMNFDEGSLLPQ